MAKRRFLKLVVANIAGSILSLLVTGFLAVQYHLYGALIALSIYQSIAFFVTLFLCYKANWFKISYLFGRIRATELLRILRLLRLWRLLVQFVCPLSQMVIRSYLSLEFGLNLLQAIGKR